LKNQLETYSRRADSYEQAAAQHAALQVIPVLEIQEAARKALRGELKDSDEESRELVARCPEAALTKSLLRWFKGDFFEWVDTLDCLGCGKKTHRTGSAEPEASERLKSAGRVELHGCDECELVRRFPRYNDPVQLLASRKGRCGEWANCFTLCGRAVGLDTRLVVDWTDHVWTEVWSAKEERWLHADPCENAIDKPLLYEKGWGKKLNYVAAFGQYGVSDVARRYTANYEEMLGRRNFFDEEQFAELIASANMEKLNRLSGKDREWEIRRQEREQIELLKDSTTKERLLPRQSGNADWIRERGEDGFQH